MYNFPLFESLRVGPCKAADGNKFREPLLATGKDSGVQDELTRDILFCITEIE
jgi:hypothetical protein